MGMPVCAIGDLGGHFNSLLCLFQHWADQLISVSDGLDMREESVGDLETKTHRGHMAHVLLGLDWMLAGKCGAGDR